MGIPVGPAGGQGCKGPGSPRGLSPDLAVSTLSCDSVCEHVCVCLNVSADAPQYTPVRAHVCVFTCVGVHICASACSPHLRCLWSLCSTDSPFPP